MNASIPRSSGPRFLINGAGGSEDVFESLGHKSKRCARRWAL